MHLPDGANTVPTLPPPEPEGTPGYFTRGDPGTGVLATVVDQDTMNMLVVELLNVLAAAGITRDQTKSNYAQVAQAVQTLIDNIPAAAVTQHQAALAIAFAQLTGSIANGQVPAAAVTQHQAALAIARTQITAEAVSGYVSGIRTYVHEDGGHASAKSVSTEVAVSTWESFGPTGSGADNEWTALDSVPANCRIALIKYEVSGIQNSATFTGNISVHNRVTGSSVATTTQTRSANMQMPDDADDKFYGNLALAVVPLDASRRFDVYWSANNISSPSVGMVLRGFIR